MGEWRNQQLAKLPKPKGCARSSRAASANKRRVQGLDSQTVLKTAAPYNGWPFESATLLQAYENEKRNSRNSYSENAKG